MKLFSGSVFFELRATHGIPWDITLQNVIDKGYTVNWVEFIDCARRNMWWDFKTLNAITFVLQDVIVDKQQVNEILTRMKFYILSNPHPNLTS